MYCSKPLGLDITVMFLVWLSEECRHSNTVYKEKAGAMSNLFHLLSHEEQLTDELFAFITDSNADHRNERAIISVLHETIPQMVSVAECMILDGVDERRYVADYVHAVATGEGLAD